MRRTGSASRCKMQKMQVELVASRCKMQKMQAELLQDAKDADVKDAVLFSIL